MILNRTPLRTPSYAVLPSILVATASAGFFLFLAGLAEHQRALRSVVEAALVMPGLACWGSAVFKTRVTGRRLSYRA